MYSMVKPILSSFRMITAKFSSVQKFRSLGIIFSDALLDLESRRQKESAEEKEDKDDDDEDDEAETAGSKGSELSADEDVYEGEDEQSSKFCDVYSDTESEEEEEEEEYVLYLHFYAMYCKFYDYKNDNFLRKNCDIFSSPEQKLNQYTCISSILSVYSVMIRLHRCKWLHAVLCL